MKNINKIKKTIRIMKEVVLRVILIMKILLNVQNVKFMVENL